ncbi:putative deoxyribose-specific abc transporter, atp-binding protein [hydrocarbon metagenome]|uniref:Putative deoxyribose-specific abc transporter, atp-binding protein n=1 Tax=hydrocarbon metagenome TaxID=938273 RepID=A0A0W8E972_9ZZZZ
MKRIPVIEMKGISKRFPGVIANDNISFRVYPGEIHALLGENGAGKSTLMSILAGLYRPDNGTIKVKGKAVRLYSPRKALEEGIGMIYQHFRLVNNFTVAENIVLGSRDINWGISQERIEKETRDMSRSYGMEIDPALRVQQLSLGEQQRVEILKMLYRGCDILIMDEPTTVLTPGEVKELFNVLRIMSRQGKSIILITHKLNEVMEIADYVTVLRRGKVVGDDRIENLDEGLLTRMMVAREVIYSQARRESEPGSIIFNIDKLNVKGDRGNIAVDKVSFNLRRGEIMAIAGVAGNGQKELVEALAGLRKVLSGSIEYEGEEIKHKDVKSRIALGINLVPEDRIGMGLVPNLSVIDNSILRSYYKEEFYSGWFLNYKKIRSYTDRIINDYDVFLSDSKHPINYLSGGNLQKLLLGREIDQSPRVLLASYPVRGLDVAAAEGVYDLLLKERDKGTAILLVLEDLEDIFRIADRVAVMYQGCIRRILDVEKTSIDEIGSIMVGAELTGV